MSQTKFPTIWSSEQILAYRQTYVIPFPVVVAARRAHCLYPERRQPYHYTRDAAILGCAHTLSRKVSIHDSLALVLYEYVTTLDDEVMHIWANLSNKRWGSKMMFFLMRYLTLIYAIVGPINDLMLMGEVSCNSPLEYSSYY